MLKSSYYKKFNKQLTKYMRMEEIGKFTEMFPAITQENPEPSYHIRGKSFKDRRNNKLRLYAVFVHEDNRLRREEDKELLRSLKLINTYQLDGLVHALAPLKEEGIPLFKTASRYV